MSESSDDVLDFVRLKVLNCESQEEQSSWASAVTSMAPALRGHPGLLDSKVSYPRPFKIRQIVDRPKNHADYVRTITYFSYVEGRERHAYL